MMRFQLELVVVCSLAASSAKTLEEVYGHRDLNPEYRAWKEDKVRGSSKAASFFSLRAPANCKFPLEVLILQDNTASFKDDRVEMRNIQLREMFTALNETHPNSKFGLMSFQDKPFAPFGQTFNYCQRLEQGLSYEQTMLYSSYDRLFPNGGDDQPESQFHGMIAAIQDARVGWSESSTKLLVLATDANPHFDLDGGNTRNLPPYSGQYEPPAIPNTVEAQCTEQYYPSPQQVIDVLQSNKIYLAQLVFDGDWAHGTVRKSWEWFNSAYGQTAAFLQPLANDSSNFWEILAKTITEIENIECPPATTPPISSVPMTASPTTSAPLTTTSATSAPATTTSATSAPTTESSVTSTSAVATASTAATSPDTVSEVGNTLSGLETTAAASETSPCQCEEGPCACPEVIIKIMERPKELHLFLKNAESSP